MADDLDGPRAEQYGYVNRLISDDQLDAEVEVSLLKAVETGLHEGAYHLDRLALVT